MKTNLPRWLFGLSLLLILLASQASAEMLSEIFRLPVTEHTLANGMRLLIVERHDSPTFSANLRFGVGSANEAVGQTGLAHLLEHMMFKGTNRFGSTDPERELPLLARKDQVYLDLQAERYAAARSPGGANPQKLADLEKEFAALQQEAKSFVIPGELWETYRRNGGVGLNASTSQDATQYFISLPKNRLELWALMESDRIRNPVFREFYTERDVVQEERRQRIDNNPRGQLMEAAVATAFVVSPYRHPVLGWPGDLKNLDRPQARAYFKTYYAPNNAVAVLVGDLDPAEVIRMVERYFGSLPSQSIPPAAISGEPTHLWERRVRVEFPAEPQLAMLYQATPIGHSDRYPLTVLASLLGQGRTSRLHKRLVEEKRLVTSIGCGGWFLRSAGLLVIQATPRTPHILEEVEAAVEQEITRMKTDLVSPQELLKVRNQIDVEAVGDLYSNAGLASYLSNAWLLTGDWRAMFSSYQKLKAVDAEAIREAARRYLIPRQRTVATLVRGETPPRASLSPPPTADWEPWESP
jgi:predicted Zn-dependent peptidase